MRLKVTAFSVFALFVSALTFGAEVQQMPKQYQDVLTTLGKSGDYKDNVLKVNIPRNDLKVTIDGLPAPTPFGFGGWLAMTPANGGQDVMMGDLVLLQEEVNPVMSAMLKNGLEVTALHNHFFFESPRIFYMHVMGHGTPEDLASRARPGLDLIGHIAGHSAQLSGDPPVTAAAQGQLDSAAISRIVGHLGEQSGAVYKITVGRDDLHVMEMGAAINTRMGLNTWAAFTGSAMDAMVAGDVAMLENEVQPVLKSLREHGLNVVAIHQHMIGSTPEIIFLHYWARGPAETLATGFKAALGQLAKGEHSAPCHIRRQPLGTLPQSGKERARRCPSGRRTLMVSAELPVHGVSDGMPAWPAGIH